MTTDERIKAHNLVAALELFLQLRSPEHTAPYCRKEPRNVQVPSDKWTARGAEDHCCLCMLNRALEYFTGEPRQVAE